MKVLLLILISVSCFAQSFVKTDLTTTPKTRTVDGTINADSIQCSQGINLATGQMFSVNGTPSDFSGSPYGQWIDVTDQTIGASAVDSAVKFNTTIFEKYITIAANDTDIVFTYSGKYLITFSAIFQSTAVTKKGAVWFTKNDATIADSGTDFILLGNSADRVVTVTYIEEFTAGDEMSLRWFGETTNVFLNTNEATGRIPLVPCIILTVNLIGL